MDNEEKYIDIRNKLQNLEQVKAGDDFEKRLHLRIVELEAEKRQAHKKKYDEPQGGFLRNLFSNRQYPWFAPAIGFTVVLFFVFYITYLNKTSVDTSKEMAATNQPVEQKDASALSDTSAISEKRNMTSNSENENQYKGDSKNLASELDNFKYEKREPIPPENQNLNTGRDESGSYDMKNDKSKPSDGIKGIDKLTKPKAPVEQKAPVEKGVLPDPRDGRTEETESVPGIETGLNDADKMSAVTAPTKEDSARKKMSMKKDTLIRTPDEKFEKMNKENLEKLIEKIQGK